MGAIVLFALGIVIGLGVTAVMLFLMGYFVERIDGFMEWFCSIEEKGEELARRKKEAKARKKHEDD